MFQIPYHTLRPATTAHLAQTMTLLSLTVGQLKQQIDTELSTNPALELVEERRCPTCRRLLPERGVCPVCSCPSSTLIDEPVVFLSPREDFYTGSGSSAERPDEDDFSVEEDNLAAYVLRQIAPELDPQDRRLAAYLLTNLDEDGLLAIPVVEVAKYFHIAPAQVKNVQRIIQRADPLGVGSSSTREALLVQMDVLGDIQFVPPLARRVVEEGMDLLSHRQFAELARYMGVSVRQVQQVVKFIGENLNPFPARSHWGDIRHPVAPNLHVYQQPDIIINFMNDNPKNPLIVEIVLPLSGTLRVSPLFRSAIQQASDEKKEAWKGDMERASLFVKCIQQRNHTLRRLVQRVVSLQRDFIVHGEQYLKPVTRSLISRDLDVHESTISRAVANKTVQLPNRRIIPLANFFDRSLNVRSILRDIIAEESSPLSDSQLVDILAQRGINVARRTVAKYRSMEGILPAHLRQSVVQQT